MTRSNGSPMITGQRYNSIPKEHLIANMFTEISSNKKSAAMKSDKRRALERS